MAWELLPVDYTDAVWAGLKRYNQINNEDGSVSFQDITSYTGKEKSFFGAKDANRMNEALNRFSMLTVGISASVKRLSRKCAMLNLWANLSTWQ